MCYQTESVKILLCDQKETLLSNQCKVFVKNDTIDQSMTSLRESRAFKLEPINLKFRKK